MTALNAPSINLITSTATTMRIVWSSPPQDFVEHYTIHLMDNSFNATRPYNTLVNGSENMATVTGLMPGKLYLVTVIANSSDVSAKSAIRAENLRKKIIGKCIDALILCTCPLVSPSIQNNVVIIQSIIKRT